MGEKEQELEDGVVGAPREPANVGSSLRDAAPVIHRDVGSNLRNAVEVVVLVFETLVVERS